MYPGIEIQNLNFGATEQSGKGKDKCKFAPEKAVDGQNTTCAMARQHNDPWWQGSLAEESVVIDITIINIGKSELSLL